MRCLHRCTSGCSCEPKPKVDALHSLRQSTIYLVRLLVSQAERCEISITLLEETRSKKHKFKVSCRLQFVSSTTHDCGSGYSRRKDQGRVSGSNIQAEGWMEWVTVQVGGLQRW